MSKIFGPGLSTDFLLLFLYQPKYSNVFWKNAFCTCYKPKLKYVCQGCQFIFSWGFLISLKRNIFNRVVNTSPSEASLPVSKQKIFGTGLSMNFLLLLHYQLKNTNSNSKLWCSIILTRNFWSRVLHKFSPISWLA